MADDGTPERVRTVRWSDPARLLEAARTRSGAELLEAVRTGALPAPPIAELIGMRITEVAAGRAVFELEAAEFLYNPLGMVHGGILATLLDSAMGCALHATLPAGTSYTTLEFQLHFVRPVTTRAGTIRAIGTLVHAGATLATAEGRIEGRDGTLFAHGTCSMMLLRPRPP